jgi:tripartite ATP-independent transporter DctP family solute receptor
MGGGSKVPARVDRRRFLGAAGAGLAGLTFACRSRAKAGQLVLRLSHSMAAGPTSLDVMAQRFREIVEARTAGAVKVQVFPNGTLGQEREIVQQIQEGLLDLMVSGTAIWGSVAPKIQVLDFPFLWRDQDHVHAAIDGAVGREAADYLEKAARIRALAWADSFGFRQVITRARDITDPRQLAGLKLRTIQSPIYVKAVELMGASPTPMAFGEIYTSLQTGVIDGYEHDASTTLQMRFYEVARFMARTCHIAGVLGLWISSATLARLPPGVRETLEQAALEAGGHQRAMGPPEDLRATEQLKAQGMTVRETDRQAFLPAAERLWAIQARELDAEPWLKAIRG